MSQGHLVHIHGHRGCAGPFPANTLPAFLEAVSIGCPWIELDVVITGDGQVLVSHEPWMDHRTCTRPGGRAIGQEEGRSINLFHLPLAEIQRYGCIPEGSLPEGGLSRDWYKPTLSEVVQAVDAAPRAPGGMPIAFNVEIKSEPAWYGTFQPSPEKLARMVVEQLARLDLLGRCLVQCFDPAVLVAAHRLMPLLPLALLVENGGPPKANLAPLDFTPAYYSAAYGLIHQGLVHDLHRQGIGVLAWTVNDPAEMLRLLDLGVDGLITDQPSLALAMLAARQ